MLLDDIRSVDSSVPALRKFGLTLGIFLYVPAGFLFWRKHSPFLIAALSVAGFLFAVFGAVVPSKLRPVQRIWMAVSLAIGWVMTRVILCALYYGLLTPLAWIARAFGEDFLRPGSRRGGGSYWLTSHITRTDKSEYERQF